MNSYYGRSSYISITVLIAAKYNRLKFCFAFDIAGLKIAVLETGNWAEFSALSRDDFIKVESWAPGSIT